jgi:hypothetical protein
MPAVTGTGELSKLVVVRAAGVTSVLVPAILRLLIKLLRTLVAVLLGTGDADG